MNRLMTVFILCLTAMHVSAQWTDAMYNRYTWRNYTNCYSAEMRIMRQELLSNLMLNL